MKWLVQHDPTDGRWLAIDPDCPDDHASTCRCNDADTQREAFRYAEWHATGRMEPTS